MRGRVRSYCLAPLLLIIGCGGGGGGGSSTPPTEPIEATEFGTAKFNVDLTSGKVAVKPLEQVSSRAVLGGQAVSFETTNILDEGGETGRRAISVKLKNNLAEAIGVGRPIRVHFGVIGAAGAYATDLRENAEVTSPVPASGTGSNDGAIGIAGLTAPTAVAVAPDGTIYFNGTDNRIRRVKEGYISTVAQNVPCNGLLHMRDSATGREYLLAASSTLSSIKIITIASGSVGTWAGLDNTPGNVNGTPSASRFSGPAGLALDSSRGQILVADAGNSAVRAINFSFSNGSLVANSVAARYSGLSQPIAVAVSSTQSVGIVEAGANRIRIFHNGGSREAIYGGTAGDVVGDGNLARFSGPRGIASIGESFFVSDANNARIKRIALKPGAAPLLASSWTVSYVAGSVAGYSDGTGTVAQFNGMDGLAIDPNNRILVAESGSNAIRRVTSTTAFDFGATDGSGSGNPELANPTGYTDLKGLRRPYIDIDQTVAPGQTIEIGQWQFGIPNTVKAFSFVVSVEAATSVFSPLEGVVNVAGGPGSKYVENQVLTANAYYEGIVPTGRLSDVGLHLFTSLDMDAAGNLYIGDYDGATVRRVDRQGNVTIIAGKWRILGYDAGNGSVARFPRVTSIRTNEAGTEIVVFGTGTVYLLSLTPGADPALATSWTSSLIGGAAATGAINGFGDTARFAIPFGCDGPSNDQIYFADFGNNTIRSMTYQGGDRNSPLSWRYDTLAGSTFGFADGVATTAQFRNPSGVAYSPTRHLYIADRENYRIRKLSLDTLNVTTVVGDGTSGDIDTGSDPLTAQLLFPTGVALDSTGTLFICDLTKIKKLSNNTVSTVSGGGSGVGTTGDKIIISEFFGSPTVAPNGDFYYAGRVGGSFHRLIRATRVLGR